VTGELVAADVASLTCQVDFAEKFLAALGSLSGVMAFPRLTPPRDPPVDFGAFFCGSRFWGLSLEHSEDRLHALLNGAMRWITIALTCKCCSDLLNLCLQHLIEAQLILRSHREAVHLGTYVFQELVSGMNLLAKFIIYPQLISDDIPELGHISIEILPITTLLVVVEWETGFVPLRVEPLIRMKTIVGVINKVGILTDCRAIDTHVACYSTLFTGHSGIDHFEMIKAWVLKLLHKINLGSEHIHLFKLVNLTGVGWSTLIIPALIRSHLLNQFVSFLNTESK
jgi:hypothetical protein